MLKVLVALAAAAISGSALGHDFWLQPRDFAVAEGASVSATLQVGHGPARQRSPIPIERIVRFESIGPSGSADQHAALHLGGSDEDVSLGLAEAGTHLVVLETNYTLTSLPAIRFNDYLEAEGLAAAQAWRAETGSQDRPGRELYCRDAKTIVLVGPRTLAEATYVTQPAGMTLEIVPQTDPALAEAGQELPVRVLYDGQPLAGALVKLTDLASDALPVAVQRTDGDGEARFTLPYSASWLLNVIWSVPLPDNPNADFLTTFSSLSFASAAETL